MLRPVLDSLLREIFIKNCDLFVLKVNRQPFNRVRLAIRLESKEGCTRFGWAEVSSINVLLNLVKVELTVSFCESCLASSCTLVNVFIDVFKTFDAASYLNITMALVFSKQVRVVWNNPFAC